MSPVLQSIDATNTGEEQRIVTLGCSRPLRRIESQPPNSSGFKMLCWLSSLIATGLTLFPTPTRALAYDTILTREATTNATCLPEFIWANNARGKSPCRMAAEVIAPCHGGRWFIPSLPPGGERFYRYDQPKGDEANTCSCSWAAYNLISACTACQGSPQSVRLWSDYKLFCPSQALNNDRILSALGKADVALAQENRKANQRPIGIIVGGVIGGLLVLIAGIVLAFLLLRNHRKKIAKAQGIIPHRIYDGNRKLPWNKGLWSYSNLTSTTDLNASHLGNQEVDAPETILLAPGRPQYPNRSPAFDQGRFVLTGTPSRGTSPPRTSLYDPHENDARSIRM
ncbi:hypothetical protein CC1G_02852 [Coprinopsis cinerea okayama7|uniref:Uncharacterized protein n=1 Tax=Coprinopsis cinerea (strain Okayama-7 / 130 / ATCC MYA-4618 / FGSC 9003) TaxID=240176 RepID=A8N083_COPC7|nr:hypothetical protein CC1G_02852 [Coprinopsis cinerea okayama7\|eukprot:XP_001828271.2 hypothetical protein CC1G_02852 [Coprinopsis cinerea okayama7\